MTIPSPLLFAPLLEYDIYWGPAYPYNFRTYDSTAGTLAMTGGSPGNAMAGGWAKGDGTKAYLLTSGASVDRISQYNIADPYDVTTGVYAGVKTGLASQDSGMQGVWMSSDGLYAFMVGTAFDSVYKYSFSVAWDITSLGYTGQSLAVGGDPRGVYLTDDGTYLLTYDQTSKTISQWSLGTAFDLSSASLVNTSSALTTTDVLRNPYVFENGAKMLISDQTGNLMIEYEMTTPYDVTTLVRTGRYAIFNGAGGAISAVVPLADGHNYYIFGNNKTLCGEYTLAANKINTFLYDGKSTITLPGTGSVENTSCWIHPEGTYFYFTNTTNDRVYQYPLTTPWDITTMTATGAKSVLVSGQDGNPRGLCFTPDGLTMYVCGDTNNKVFQYTLGTAWDVSTASYASKFATVYSGTDYDARVSKDGNYLFVLSTDTDTVFRYPLSTPFDVSTAGASDQSVVLTSYDPYPGSFFFNEEGTKMTMVAQFNHLLRNFNLSTAWDLSTLTSEDGGYTTNVVTTSPEYGCWSCYGEESASGVPNSGYYFYLIDSARYVYGFHTE